MTLARVELGREDADDLLRLFRGYGWWEDRDRDGVARALANTDVAIGLRENGDDDSAGEDGELVAAARVITEMQGGSPRL